MIDWLNERYPNGWLGYGPWWLLRHPWLAVPEIGRRIKWAWQRVFRGWDDRVTWSIDGYLNEHMPEWLRALRDEDTGVPMCLYGEAEWESMAHAKRPPEGAADRAHARWHAILNRMIAGFEAGHKLDECGYQNDDERAQLEAQLDDGLRLFATYYRDLWD
jgi:hypothetical protein